MSKKTPLLTFGIPTWNRAEFLRVCVTAMAEQIAGCDANVRIFISDNASDDATPAVVQQLQAIYPFIDYTRMEIHGDFADNLKNVFSQVGGDYCWLIGDDDQIAPGALRVALEVLKGGQLDFVHCCDAARASGEHKIVMGSLFDLCNRLGWLEVTGFLSSCLVRSSHLNKVASSATWPIHRQNAYPHACHFLETIGPLPAAVVDAPMVTLQSPKQTEETLVRWRQESIGTRYFMVVQSLPLLVAAGAMPARVNALFFRYHKYYLWNKFATSLIYEVYNSASEFSDDMWKVVAMLADYVDDDALAVRIHREIDTAKSACLSLGAARRATEQAGLALNGLFDMMNMTPLAYALTAP